MKTKMLMGGAVLLAAAGGLALSVRAQSGDTTPVLTLETLMRGTGLEYQQTRHGNFNVFFTAEAAKGVEGWAVLIRYNNPDTKDYVMVYCTMIDRPDGHKLPAEAVAAALAYNSKNLGAHMAMDEKAGDIDVMWTVPTKFVTSALLRYCVQDVAATCDQNCNAFTKLAPEPPSN
jgi:hypothetical protein